MERYSEIYSEKYYRLRRYCAILHNIVKCPIFTHIAKYLGNRGKTRKCRVVSLSVFLWVSTGPNVRFIVQFWAE